MATPQFFSDGLGLDMDEDGVTIGVHGFSDTYGDDWRGNSLASWDHDYRVPMYTVHDDGELRYPTPSKTGKGVGDEGEGRTASMWARTEETQAGITSSLSGAITVAVSQHQQPMFVQPGLYTEDDDSVATMRPLGRGRKKKTPSMTPELQPSDIRPGSSIKSESRSPPSLSPMSQLDALPAPKTKKQRTSRVTIRRNATNNNNNYSAAAAGPPGRRKQHPRASSAQLDGNKRNKFLERNRVAASKCRDKKKVMVSQLEETANTVERQRAELHVLRNALLSEAGDLKHMLMLHAKCNDDMIDGWIANEARRFVQTTTDLFGTIEAEVVKAAGAEQPPHQGHMHRQSSDSSLANSEAQRRQSSSASSSAVHGGAGTAYGSFSSSTTSGGPEDRRDSMPYSKGTSLNDWPDGREGEKEVDGGGGGGGVLRFADADADAEALLCHGADQAWLIASSVDTSPTDIAFHSLTSPKSMAREVMNFDHMPDEMFAAE